MKISNIGELQRYICHNSNLSPITIGNVIKSLRFPLNSAEKHFKELSTILVNCAEHGANIGVPGFITYSDTIKFYRNNREAIVKHMEEAAAEFGTDIFSMVQNFGEFRKCVKPGPSEIGKALWDSRNREELHYLYNVFAWYALEEVSYTWYRYLEDNPAYYAELSA
jgi:hypothetical protein